MAAVRAASVAEAVRRQSAFAQSRRFCAVEFVAVIARRRSDSDAAARALSFGFSLFQARPPINFSQRIDESGVEDGLHPP
ncbi:hypothetical protein bcgnr5380_61090 [Bacillus cereus]|uniref:Uncharacterized protein n=1 Tax=Lysobacter enzymogenes TaxID=69 RepID=A0AAU9AY53_LYSEN|nr:hypothetical protein LEN_2804 [Lysobacter enzymogenes]